MLFPSPCRQDRNNFIPLDVWPGLVGFIMTSRGQKAFSNHSKEDERVVRDYPPLAHLALFLTVLRPSGVEKMPIVSSMQGANAADFIKLSILSHAGNQLVLCKRSSASMAGSAFDILHKRLMEGLPIMYRHL